MQNRSSAVMEQRAPDSIEAEDPKRALRRKLDWFATPPWASRAGAELVCAFDPNAWSVWEPAAGDGIMAACLQENFVKLIATDIFPQSHTVRQWNFLEASDSVVCPKVDWVITNPPFRLAEQFVQRGLEVARRGVALLCRTAFLESVSRYPMHDRHLAQAAIFCERVPMQLGPWEPDCSTATSYAWFLFDRFNKRGTHALSFIPPGTRDRLWKADDVQRFATAKDLPLMERSS